MAELWDKEIDESVDWGGDSSTDNLPVKGSRVQEFIKKELSKRVKSIKIIKGVEEETVSPDGEGIVAIEIPTIEVDNTLIDQSTNPVSGGAVKAQFDGLGSKYGASLKLNTLGDEANRVYSISLLDENEEVISTTEQFSASGGEVQTTKIVLTRLTENPTVKKGDEVKLSYFYDQVDTSSESSTGNSAKVSISIIFGANTYTIEDTISAGSTNQIDVTNYLGVGTNTVRVKVTVGEGAEQQTSSISWSVSVVELILSSSFSFVNVVDKGNSISIPYALSGAGSKTLRCYLDGVDIEDKSITASTANGSFTIDTSELNHGTHSVQLVVELDLVGKTINSNSIYFGIAVRESGNTTPIVVSRFDYSDGTIIESGETPYIQAKQFEYYTLRYSVYDPTMTPTSVSVYEESKLLSSANISFVTQELTVRSMDSGVKNCRIVTRDGEYLYKLNIQKSDLDITEPTDNLALKLSAEGRSNNDVDRDSWSYNGITTEFEGFKWGGDGWLNNALRLTDRARATIKYSPLKQPEFNANNAMAFVIKFKVTEVSDDNAQVIKCLDAEGTGFVISSQEAMMQTKGKSQLSMKLASGNVYEVAFVSFPKSTDLSSEYEKQNTEMVYLYINGIMSGCVQRSSSDSIYQGDAEYIKLGADGATVDIYNVRAYTTYLSDSQVLDLYILNLSTVEELLAKYNENDVIDSNGNVTVDNVPDGMRYVIVTGKQANGVPTVLQAAINNDKDPKYDVDEILCIKKGTKELNFRLIGGCIRLQGTSSLAYPIKNYRIYFKNASKQEGQLYLGCDEQGVGGELQEEAKYSFRLSSSSQKEPIPVNCFCLKADFAESSSSHNTGMAKLVQNVLSSANELTPAQKHVSPDYQYDIRTTVDGEPCYMFYRANITDTPIFLGKFNWNNDKSTEDVFGFLDIPGYHDQQWVTDKFEGQNPTECWEFLNNDYPMGMFLDDDFDTKGDDGTPNWLKVFEARFPDDDDRNAQFEAGTLKPKYLEMTVKWIKSTQNDGAKFKRELANYFDVNYLCDYYMFTDIFGCVDQRVKNMMLGFWYNEEAYSEEDPMNGMRGYFIFYDNDTIMGVRNDGRLKYSWDIDSETIDEELTTPERTVYAYAGHDSILWKNLREQFPDELKAAYVRIRNNMSNDVIFNMFDKEQSSKFCERIYNLDAINKYVKPKTIGVEVVENGETSNVKYSYLEAMQGSRQSHRKWWVNNRTGLFDARYSTGTYYSTDIQFKGVSAGSVTIKATPSRDFYFEFKRENDTLVHEAVTKDVEWSYTYSQEANIGTIFHFYGGAWMKKLNLSEWGGFTDLTLPVLPVLEELILGNSSKVYNLTELIIGNKVPMVKNIQLVNYAKLSSLDLSDCTRLENLNTEGCTSLTSISFAEGAPLANLHLPENYQTLILKSMPYLTRDNIIFDNANNLTGLWIENCPQIDSYEMFKEFFNMISSGGKLKYVRVTGLNLSGDGSDLKLYYDAKLGGINASGNTVTNKCKLVGNYQLTKYLNDEEYAKYVEYFDELSIKQPLYTAIEFDDSELDPKNISNLDNQTGYKFDNEYQVSGHVLTILNKRHRCLGKKTADGEVTICMLDDSNSNRYHDGTTSDLTGNEGDAFVYEPTYWYKGINDILNMKKYALFSSAKEMPASTGETKIIKKEEIEFRSNLGVISTGEIGSNISNSIVSYSDYSYGVVDVKGYKQVRFPGIDSAVYGAALVDDNGLIIKTMSAPSSNGMLRGMYLFTNVENASKLYFTVYPSEPVEDVILTTSEDIEAIEPEWVQREECLGGVFPMYLKDGVPCSVTTGNYNISSITISNMTSVCKAKGTGYTGWFWNLNSEIACLMMSKYGSRNSQAIFGIGYTSSYNLGKTASIGMQDTFPNPLDKNESSAYAIVDGSSQNIENENFLGYEKLQSSITAFIDIAFRSNLESKIYMRSLNKDNSERIILVKPGNYNHTAGSPVYGKFVLWGKYTDALSLRIDYSSMNGETGYCDTTDFSWNVSGAYSKIGKNGTNQFSSGIFNISYLSDDNKISHRLCFRGTIRIESNVTKFKSL